MPATQSAIEWTDATWNPIHGCAKVSEGCKNCYAARQSHERYGHTPEPWQFDNLEKNLRIQDHHLDFPASLDEPQRVFVNSMSDLFLPEELLEDDYIHRIMDVIDIHPEHVFIALTKHGAETGDSHGEVPRLRRWDREYERWPDNLWMGVSVESQNRAYRLDELRATGAATKWASFEPLVGPVTTTLEGLDWAVVGGESHREQRQRREMDHAWARTIRRQARDAGIPFYFKQSSGPRQGYDPELAEDGANPHEAEVVGAGTSVHRELPELTPALREACPDLAAQEVAHG